MHNFNCKNDSCGEQGDSKQYSPNPDIGIIEKENIRLRRIINLVFLGFFIVIWLTCFLVIILNYEYVKFEFPNPFGIVELQRYLIPGLNHMPTVGDIYYEKESTGKNIGIFWYPVLFVAFLGHIKSLPAILFYFSVFWIMFVLPFLVKGLTRNSVIEITMWILIASMLIVSAYDWKFYLIVFLLWSTPLAAIVSGYRTAKALDII